MTEQPESPERRLRLPSPGMLLVVALVVVVLAVGVTLLAPVIANLHLVKQIEDADGIVQFSEGEPEWLCDALGDDLRRGVDPIIAVCVFPGPGKESATREIVAGIRGRQSILGLQLDLTDDELAQLDCPHLESLNLFGSATDAGAVHLLRFPELTSLNLQDSPMTDAGVAEIAKIPHLRRLEFNSCPMITDAGIEHLKAHAELEYLRISVSGRITDEALRFTSQIPHLDYLDIQRLPSVSDAGIAHLADAPIRRLNIWNLSGVVGPGLRELEHCTSLRYLNLGGSWYGDDVIPHLSEFSQVTRIELYETSISREAADRLQEALPSCDVVWRNDEPGAAIIGGAP